METETKLGGSRGRFPNFHENWQSVGGTLSILCTLFIAVFALAAPWSIAVAQIAVISTTLVLVIGLARRSTSWVSIPKTLWMVLIFAGFQAISIPLGIHPERSLSCFKGSWTLLFPFVFWIALQDRSRRRSALWILFVSGVLAGIYGIVQHYQGYDWVHAKELEAYEGGGYLSVGSFGGHLTYAGVLLPLFFLGVGLSKSRTERWQEVLCLLGSTILGLALVFTFARSAWVGTAGGLLLFGALRGRRWFFLGLGILATTSILASLAEPALAQRLVSIFSVNETPRWRLWQTALGIVRDHPWFGAGLGSFKTLFPIYKVPGHYLASGHPHHDVLNVMVETGIIGTVAWGGMWFAFFRETRQRIARSVPRAQSSWLADGLRISVAALLIGGLAQCFFTDEEVSQLWWFITIAGILEARDVRGQAERESHPTG